jgi:hypothetical protein
MNYLPYVKILFFIFQLSAADSPFLPVARSLQPEAFNYCSSLMLYTLDLVIDTSWFL